MSAPASARFPETLDECERAGFAAFRDHTRSFKFRPLPPVNPYHGYEAFTEEAWAWDLGFRLARHIVGEGHAHSA